MKQKLKFTHVNEFNQQKNQHVIINFPMVIEYETQMIFF